MLNKLLIYWLSTDFYWRSTDLYWPSTDSLLTLYMADQADWANWADRAKSENGISYLLTYWANL